MNLSPTPRPPAPEVRTPEPRLAASRRLCHRGPCDSAPAVSRACWVRPQKTHHYVPPVFTGISLLLVLFAFLLAGLFLPNKDVI